jgi:hypothetical protein
LMLCLTGAGIGTFSLVRAQSGAGDAGAAPPVDPFSYTAKLSDGRSVELIGVCDHPSRGLPWWRADGTPLPTAPYDHFNGALNMSRMVVREFAVRVSVPQPGDVYDEVDWYFPAAVGVTGSQGGALDAANRRVPGIEAITIGLPDAPQGITLRADFASGPWKTIAAAPPTGAEARLVNAVTYRWSAPKEIKGKTQYLFTRTGLMRPSLHERVIAIDTQGRASSVLVTTVNGNIFTRSGELTVPLPLASIKELQLQQRPYEKWIEIRNISLHADKQTQVQIVTSDQAANAPATMPQ